MSEETTDQVATRWLPPWGWPGFLLIRSYINSRWSLLMWFHTDETEQWPHYTFTWFLQLRLWWPPIYFYRGWLRWD